MPFPDYAQVGSFRAPVVPPALGPFEGTLVSLPCINPDWLRLLLGAADQLRNPSSWAGLTPSQTVDILGQVEDLRRQLSIAGPCVICPEMRLQDCVLQFSCDSGATWTDVTGWAENFASCVNAAVTIPPQTQLQFDTSCELQESFDGGDSWSNVPGWTDNFPTCVTGILIPPVPPNPQPFPDDQHACNIAGAISKEVIQLVVAKAVAAYNSDLTTLQFGTSIFDSIAWAFPITAIAMDVFYAFYLEVNALSIGAFTTAETDPVLVSDLTCAIYSAIRTVGYIDATNIADVITNVCGITYTYPQVISAICGFVTNIGLANFQGMQNVGALDLEDCSGCASPPTPWCYRFDFTSSMNTWSPENYDGTFPWPDNDGYSLWVNTVGWTRYYNVSNSLLLIRRNFPATYITTVTVHYEETAYTSPQFHEFDSYLAGSLVTSNPISHAPGAGPTTNTFTLNHKQDRFDVYMSSNATSNEGHISAIDICGTGGCPFGAPNL
jgi:hypothetical protein